MYYFLTWKKPIRCMVNFYIFQLAVDSLSQRGNIWYRHILLSVDVILFDEVGQLSSEQFSLLDIILRQITKNDTPFGGALTYANRINSRSSILTFFSSFDRLHNFEVGAFDTSGG